MIGKTVDFDKLYDDLQGCEGCDLSNREENRLDASLGHGKLRGYSRGYREGGVMFVAQNPSHIRIHGVTTPCDDGICRVLLLILKDKGFRDDEIFFTNLVKCSTERNKVPDKGCRETCSRRWLNKELKAARPRLIVSLGGTASARFGARIRKGLVYRRLGGHWTPIFPMYHPGFIFRGNFGEFSKQLDKLVELRDESKN